ncbi:hypothetical protein ACSSNL_18590 [Thalassobius sp. S69A]|uniref:hypothetical protein n=1 Tax=unclassified Thalassovita TaxID=2619711 RepID=UPI003C7971C4
MTDTTPKKVRYDGKEYPSIIAAARALNTWPGVLSRSIAKGEYFGKKIEAKVTFDD